MTSNGLGTRIEKARVTAGLRRVDLASKTGLSAGTIRNYEEGITRVSAENLQLIAEATGRPLSWFFEEVAA